MEPRPSYPILPEPVAAPTVPVLDDGVERIRLTGGLERQQFHPLLAAVLVSIGGFLLFQVVGTLVSVVLIILRMQREGALLEVTGVMERLLASPDLLLLGNAIGQFVGFGALVLLATRLHTPDVGAFLFLRKPDLRLFGLSVAGLVAMLPLIQWLVWFNQQLPLPESLTAWDRQQMELIEQVLLNLNVPLWAALFMVAVTPALCEEVLFRGYLMRQVSRPAGLLASIVITGVLFGAYHLRVTQVLPLALLGIYLGLAVWATRSLWTGVVLHFLNNGLAVVVADYVKRHPESDMVALEEATVPWYLALGSALLVALVVRTLWRRLAATAPPPLPAPLA